MITWYSHHSAWLDPGGPDYIPVWMAKQMCVAIVPESRVPQPFTWKLDKQEMGNGSMDETEICSNATWTEMNWN